MLPIFFLRVYSIKFGFTDAQVQPWLQKLEKHKENAWVA